MNFGGYFYDLQINQFEFNEFKNIKAAKMILQLAANIVLQKDKPNTQPRSGCDGTKRPWFLWPGFAYGFAIPMRNEPI